MRRCNIAAHAPGIERRSLAAKQEGSVVARKSVAGTCAADGGMFSVLFGLRQYRRLTFVIENEAIKGLQIVGLRYGN